MREFVSANSRHPGSSAREPLSGLCRPRLVSRESRGHHGNPAENSQIGHTTLASRCPKWSLFGCPARIVSAITSKSMSLCHSGPEKGPPECKKEIFVKRHPVLGSQLHRQLLRIPARETRAVAPVLGPHRLARPWGIMVPF